MKEFLSICLVSFAVVAGAADSPENDKSKSSKVDQEISQKLDFFVNMEVIENLSLLEIMEIKDLDQVASSDVDANTHPAEK